MAGADGSLLFYLTPRPRWESDKDYLVFTEKGTSHTPMTYYIWFQNTGGVSGIVSCGWKQPFTYSRFRESAIQAGFMTVVLIVGVTHIHMPRSSDNLIMTSGLTQPVDLVLTVRRARYLHIESHGSNITKRRFLLVTFCSDLICQSKWNSYIQTIGIQLHFLMDIWQKSHHKSAYEQGRKNECSFLRKQSTTDT